MIVIIVVHPKNQSGYILKSEINYRLSFSIKCYPCNRVCKSWYKQEKKPRERPEKRRIWWGIPSHSLEGDWVSAQSLEQQNPLET